MSRPTHVLGLDLAGPTNAADTAAAVFAVRGTGLELTGLESGLDDVTLVDWVRRVIPVEGVTAVGLDAPLSYNPGGGDRPGDAALRTRLIAAGLAPGTVMAPTMTRMAYLTLRGVTVARLLESILCECRIAEVHPGGSMVLRGAPADDVREMKRSAGSCGRLRDHFGPFGVAGIPADLDDHALAACAAALGAFDWARGRAVWWHQADSPHHPFDLVC